MDKTRQRGLTEAFHNGSVRALAKALTLVESRGDGYENLMSNLDNTSNCSYCIGITGPPGAGKSTLVDKLIYMMRRGGKNGATVGILAIDPSSPFSGGAVLGDRIRMQDHAGDSGVFIRSIGSRGSHGGLSRATRDMVRVLTAFGFDYVMVETVGVGQTELDIMELADTTIVVLVPEAGDTIQTMKAGLLEIADIFVINKCDRGGAGQIKGGLQGLIEMDKDAPWTIPILETEATKNSGIEELFDTIGRHKDFSKRDESRKGHQGEIRSAELVQITLERLKRIVEDRIATDKKLRGLVEKVKSGTENPYKASMEILGKVLK